MIEVLVFNTTFLLSILIAGIFLWLTIFYALIMKEMVIKRMAVRKGLDKINSAKYVQKIQSLTKGLGLLTKFKKHRLPSLTNKVVITPRSPYWEHRIKWVPKFNK